MITSTVDFYDDLFYLSIKRPKKKKKDCEKCSSQFPRSQTDVFRRLLLFDQQSKIQRLFIYCHKWQCSDPYINRQIFFHSHTASLQWSALYQGSVWDTQEWTHTALLMHSRWHSHSFGAQHLFSGPSEPLSETLSQCTISPWWKHADIKCTATRLASYLAAELPADCKWALISNLTWRLTPNYKGSPVNIRKLKLARLICMKGCSTLLCKVLQLVNWWRRCVPVCFEMRKTRLIC